MRRVLLAFAACALAVALPGPLAAQEPTRDTVTFTHADTLRGSDGPGRSWWDATFYDLHIQVAPADSTVSGWNAITYTVTDEPREMQIDLQEPLVVDSVVQAGQALEVRRDGNAVFVRTVGEPDMGSSHTITVHYHGRPRVAVNPPWDGGLIWTRDARGNPWVATADQGLGASVFWPNKDFGGDEPDSQRVAVTVPRPLVDVSNGRLRSTTVNPDGTTTFEWFVANPINNYGIALNAGVYAHWRERYDGAQGPLALDFWPLAANEPEARRQWTQVRPMLGCFEHWFGPYPWYEDGYKLVEAPHLGMEHQSAIGYGNGYQNGYLGEDLSGTGRGLGWDFIIVHESAHEWWGNSITARDIADMWVHESFANYAESLFVECRTDSEEAGAEYVIGTRDRILNDRPIVGRFGVHDEGSGDMYYKGGNMLHTIRQLVEDDEKWRGILRGLNQEFRHQIVTGQQIRDAISRATGIDLSQVFEQYLETTLVPTLEYRIEGDTLHYRWTAVVDGFDMPVRARLSSGGTAWIQPTEAWQSQAVTLPDSAELQVDPDFYVRTRRAPRG